MPRKYKVTPPEVRFWAKVRKGAGCWLWIGATADTGYGVFNTGGGRLVSAHRFSYMLETGRALAAGECVLHRCDVRHCVRPDHLFVGSLADNNRDMKEKGRARNKPFHGSTHPRAKLTPAKIAAAKRLWTNRGKVGREAQGVTLVQLAERYGVAPSTLHAALTGRTWRTG